MIITLSGKGGVGKTTVAALLIDEVARHGYPGKVLAIDGDPAMTLAMTLWLEPPPVTLADIRDDTPFNARQIRGLPPGMSPAQFVLKQLKTRGAVARRKLRGMAFDLMAMGRGEGPGCYCSVNQALTGALAAVRAEYDLIIIDNEAGLEHISRYRLHRVDWLLLVLRSLSPTGWAYRCCKCAIPKRPGTARLRVKLQKRRLFYDQLTLAGHRALLDTGATPDMVAPDCARNSRGAWTKLAFMSNDHHRV